VTGFDEQGNPTSPLIDFARNARGFDVIFGDHTDEQFEGVINGALVVESRSKGATYSRTTLTNERWMLIVGLGAITFVAGPLWHLWIARILVHRVEEDVR
jgi:2',3'-cyclic-nucleotide 2'-phosphodiesterase (5'-nucleotidase family)